MEIQAIPIKDLKPDPANARSHDSENIEAISRSLKRFGQQKPIVVNQDGVVIAGNGTLEAAQSLGWKKIAVVHTTLADEEQTLFAIADNRSSELARWNIPQLDLTLRALDLDTLGDLGFDEMALDEILPQPGEEEELTNDERNPGLGSPVIQAAIVFDTEEQQRRFRTFMRWVRNKYDGDTTAESLDGHIQEVLTDG